MNMVFVCCLSLHFVLFFLFVRADELACKYACLKGYAACPVSLVRLLGEQRGFPLKGTGAFSTRKEGSF